MKKSLFLRFLPDKLYLSMRYKAIFGKKLNFRKPVTFNEKLQWLKLYDRKDAYTVMVDKSRVKEYVADIIGEEYVIPTLGIYDKFEEIDFDELPDRFVVKCTHDSGGLVIVKDKNDLDKESTKKKINDCLKKNYYYRSREWPYKNIKPRIIVEEYMEDSDGGKLTDYKFLCFNGRPKLFYISENSHFEDQKIAFFDMDFKQLPIKRSDYKDYDALPPRPRNFKKMVKIAEKLSSDFTHVRVDFYNIDGKIYFGEFTFYTGSGYIPFLDEKWDKKLGDLIDLSLTK